MPSEYRRYLVHSATIMGVRAVPVDVEVVVSAGMPGFQIVGRPESTIFDSRERVRSALRGCGFKVPADHVVVNLAPGSIRKQGSGFDLPIAVGILAATGQIPTEGLSEALVVGELSLQGEVRPVTGLLAHQVLARSRKQALMCALPDDGLVPMDGLRLQTMETLQDLRASRFGSSAGARRLPDPVATPDFADVAGQDMAKRALEIAAVGGHGLLMMGPPGAGKSMLASCLPGILPPLSEDERLETALIHSVAGLDISSILAGRRPFRTPHHSATSAGLCGGGSPVRPGELSLAHNGVLFLDEIPEFRSGVLQGIRQPIEAGYIDIIRAEGALRFPSRFMLVAASNPCPCGYYGDDVTPCRCSAGQVSAYQGKIGGPLIDRFDMRIDVSRCDLERVVDGSRGEPSQAIASRVMAAREFASFRCKGQPRPRSGDVAELTASCKLDDESRRFLTTTAYAKTLSARGMIRILGVARTIADMRESEAVGVDDLLEASCLRTDVAMGGS